MNKFIKFLKIYNKIKKLLYLFLAFFSLGTIFSYIYFFFKLISYFKNLGLLGNINFITLFSNIITWHVGDEAEILNDDIPQEPEKEEVIEITLEEYRKRYPYWAIFREFLHFISMTILEVTDVTKDQATGQPLNKPHKSTIPLKIELREGDEAWEFDIKQICSVIFDNEKGLENTEFKEPKRSYIYMTDEEFEKFGLELNSKEFKALVQYLIDNNYITLFIFLIYYFFAFRTAGKGRNENEDNENNE